MYKLIIFLIIIVLFSSLNQTLSQEQVGNVEIYVYNYTDHNIYIQLYPVSNVFNGYNMYNLVAKARSNYPINLRRYDYINCVYWPPENWPYRRILIPGQSDGYNVDIESEGNGSALGSYGFGIYKLDIHHTYAGRTNEKKDSCLIEFDYYDGGTTPGDLFIRLYNDDVTPRFTYQFDVLRKVPIDYESTSHYKIESWRPNGNQINSRSKRYGPSLSDPDNTYFTYKNESDPIFNLYNWYPLDSRKDCYNNIPPFGLVNQNQVFPFIIDLPGGPFYDDERQGTLTLNLYIQKDITTPTEYWNPQVTYPAPIIIEQDVKFRIASARSFKLLSVPENFQIRELRIQPNALLWLEDSFYSDEESWHPTLLELYGKNTLTLEQGSKMRMNTSPPELYSATAIIINEGGGYCDKGALKEGRVVIHYSSGSHWLTCPSPRDYIFDDSTNVITDSNAIIVIPDSSNLILDGNYTCLKSFYGSTFKFGHSSKLILQNGASLIADHATFTSLDSNSTWDGIYLYDISNDTITNCTIENAANGINIKNKYSFTGNQPSTEISNCTFSNTTTTQLTNGIYASASNNVLIRNSNFTSSQLVDAFADGIMLEY